MSRNENAQITRRAVLSSAVAAGVGGASLSTAGSESAEAGSITGGCLAELPDPVEKRIEIDGDRPEQSDAVPESGDIILYIHGLFSEDIGDALDNGANQAAALEESLNNNGEETPVVAGMWNSTTTWTVAKWRAEDAGEVLAEWLRENRDDYGDVTIVGHSLGARVTLTALNEFADDDVTVTSVALLGAAVNPDAPCTEFKEGIEESIDGKLYNYYSEEDNIVRRIYAIREFTSGLGSVGADCSGGWFSSGSDLPENYEDVDVTDKAKGHCEYYQPDSVGPEGENIVPEIIENQF